MVGSIKIRLDMGRIFLMYTKYTRTKHDVLQSEQKPLAIMCDLDGTLCINDQGRSPFDYHKARHDAVNQAVAETLWAFVEGHPNIDIVFVSAREEYGRETFIDWLRHHMAICSFKGGINLYMRQDQDFRKDTVVKEEIYRNDIQPYWDILFVLDDRDQVVKMWRNKLGLTCFQVAEGKF